MDNSLPVDFDLSSEFVKAFDTMEDTRDNIFITGKAGTGKSTLLRYFIANTSKNVAVLAPTGVSAINIGGQTIHSFFKFPPRFLFSDSLKRRYKNKVMENLDTIVIDEVSMVRADLMDAIDRSLRHARRNDKAAFGGVQMIFFGDLFQLPPVVEDDLKVIMSKHYTSPYFFSARVLKDSSIRYIELSKIYRQKDRFFIELLDRLRTGAHTKNDLDLLNSRFEKNSKDIKNGTVVLTSTNRVASVLNDKRLSELTGEEYVYEANISGDLDEFSYPVSASLRLKKGAQVIFLRNDHDKRWVNGTIGTVSLLADDKIAVDVDGNIYEVDMVKWEKIEYSYNEADSSVEEDIIGIFEQYPLKLAWAITIHRSQGQTFDSIVLDLGHGAFAHGQTYVALSRCTGLKGIILKRPISGNDIIFDRRIYDFQDRFATLGL